MPDPELAIALALVRNARGDTLIGRRATDSHQGGKLEFPGGKVKSGETSAAAMVRELREETGLVASEYRPLISLPHHYVADNLRLRLDCFLVSDWRIKDDQLLRLWHWQPGQALDPARFPAANAGIIGALKLPDEWMITATLQTPPEQILSTCQRAIDSGVRMICLRDPQLSPPDYQRIAAQLLPSLQNSGCEVILNCPADLPIVQQADGLHLTSERLMAASDRPLSESRWCSAACHNSAELQRAAELGLDFVTLSPVQQTRTHPEVSPMGWDRFATLVAPVPLPVYALGGMSRSDKDRAQRAGAQGVAGITLFL